MGLPSSLEDLRNAIGALRVFVIGSINHDLFLHVDGRPADDCTLRVNSINRSLGGHGANCASAAGRLGASVGLIGAVGNDEYGQLSLEDLWNCGISTQEIVTVPDVPTGFVTIPSGVGMRYMLMHRGANDADPRVTDDALVKRAFAADVVILMDPRPELAKNILECRARHQSCRLVWAPGGMPSSLDLLSEYGACADAVILNRAEFAQVKRQGLVADGASLTRPGTALIVTEGRDGAIVHDRNGVSKYPAFDVETIDATGAGDAFVAAYALFSSIDRVSTEECVSISSLCGALSTTAVGARTAHPAFAGLSLEIERRAASHLVSERAVR
tara:strand:- start:4317 stop:5303 length:987 start_codon:yes stop_codon:yes gene_type:complete